MRWWSLVSLLMFPVQSWSWVPPWSLSRVARSCSYYSWCRRRWSQCFRPRHRTQGGGEAQPRRRPPRRVFSLHFLPWVRAPSASGCPHLPNLCSLEADDLQRLLQVSAFEPISWTSLIDFPSAPPLSMRTVVRLVQRQDGGSRDRERSAGTVCGEPGAGRGRDGVFANLSAPTAIHSEDALPAAIRSW